MEVGLEKFLARSHKKYKGQRLGVLCNQASNDKKLRHIRDLITDKKLGLNITAFFGPQHGIRGEKQDDMKESEDFFDPKYGIPVYSLYSKTRQPTEAMLERIDTFVVDLQDVGTRIYTFMYTLANCMRAARRTGKKVVVLDRPNPIDGVHTEGNVLDPEFSSFVGQYPLCTRHGMTMAELALLFNEEFEIGCDLDIIKCTGWNRAMYADDWGRPWIPPSPNMPILESVLTFPGTVHFEGTNVSEGRGTTHPFEWIAAPYIDADQLAEVMNKMKLPGVYFRPMYMQPTYQKGKDQVCGGVQIHVTNRKSFNSFRSGVHLLDRIANLYPKDFEWKQPPYEYEFDKMPIDLITGTDKLRLQVERGKGIRSFENQAQEELAQFRKVRKNYLIY